jgi:putative phosphoribosyl transferase
MIFRNRQHAGQTLAKRLKSISLQNPIVLALPRGGVPVAFEIAKALKAPLDVLIVRKIGAPARPEYGIGAITEGGYYWIDQEAALAVRASETEIEKVITRESLEVERRISEYRGGKPLPHLKGRSVIVVDDGLATGVTARVGCHYLKNQGANQVVLAVPVCSPRTIGFLRSEVDQVICLEEPEFFLAVGHFYKDFIQTSDEEVIELLKKSKEWQTETPVNLNQKFESRPRKNEVVISEKEVRLPGTLFIPEKAQGVVIFAHGSGSGRLSPRNQKVSGILNQAGLGTLLFDLLTEDESLNRANVFDIPLLASRLILATQWLKKQNAAKDLPIGYFGASTGGGAALWAAADLKNEI